MKHADRLIEPHPVPRGRPEPAAAQQAAASARPCPSSSSATSSSSTTRSSASTRASPSRARWATTRSRELLETHPRLRGGAHRLARDPARADPPGRRAELPRAAAPRLTPSDASCRVPVTANARGMPGDRTAARQSPARPLASMSRTVVSRSPSELRSTAGAPIESRGASAAAGDAPPASGVLEGFVGEVGLRLRSEEEVDELARLVLVVRRPQQADAADEDEVAQVAGFEQVVGGGHLRVLHLGQLVVGVVHQPEVHVASTDGRRDGRAVAVGLGAVGLQGREPRQGLVVADRLSHRGGPAPRLRRARGDCNSTRAAAVSSGPVARPLSFSALPRHSKA